MHKVARIERFNYLLTAIAGLIVLYTQSGRISLGFTVGAVLTCANFFVLRKLVTKWTIDAARGETGPAPYLMLPKMVGLMGAVAVAILLLPIDAIAFVIGYSIFLVSIVIEMIYSAVVPSPDPAKEKNTDG
ncbi:MAG TPA: ATP synthase subunit I [Kofleriaceae bacterium]